MVDPVSSDAASKIAQNQSASGADPGADAPDGAASDGPSFQEVLEGEQSVDEPAGAGGVEKTESAGAIDPVEMEEIEATESAGVDERRVKFRKFMEKISEQHDEIDAMIDRSIEGEQLDQKELLEMQALIYSYSQRVELTSKVVEKGTGGLKQMMQMQV